MMNAAAINPAAGFGVKDVTLGEEVFERAEFGPGEQPAGRFYISSDNPPLPSRRESVRSERNDERRIVLPPQSLLNDAVVGIERYPRMKIRQLVGPTAKATANGSAASRLKNQTPGSRPRKWT